MSFLRTTALLVGCGLLLGACGARTDPSDLFPPGGVGGQRAGGGSGPGPSDCCSPQSEAGCGDAVIEACVCEYLPSCCADRWSGECALIVPLAGCGSCTDGSGGLSSGGGPPITGGRPGIGGGPSTGGSSIGGQFPSGGAANTGGVSPAGGQGAGGTTNSCCVTGQPGVSGCADGIVERCVCADDPFCCEEGWDIYCVNRAQACGACGGGSGGQGAGGQGPGGTAGIGGQGAGGNLATGGQGVGGAFVELCSDFLGPLCGDCLCETCASSIAGCVDDNGCREIFLCAASTGCTGVDCYQDGTCKDVIDTWEDSLPAALRLIACSSTSGCSCF